MTELHYHGKQPQVLGELADGRSEFHCEFTALPEASVYRPPCPPKPRVPYALPEHKTRSTFKTASSPGSANANELRFEDKAGQEQIYLHAAKDYDQLIDHNKKTEVLNDRHTDIHGHHYGRTQGDHHHTVNGTHHSRTDGDRHEQVGGSRHTELGSQELLKAGKEIHLSSGHKVVLDAGAELTLKAGGSYLKLDPSGVTLVGPSINLNAGGSPSKGTGQGVLKPTRYIPSQINGTSPSGLSYKKTQAVQVFADSTGPAAMGPVDDRVIADTLVALQRQQNIMLPSGLVRASSSSLTNTQQALTPELIAIAGSQHDKGYGNKMMFIGQAVRELGEFKRNKHALTRTLVVFTPSYSNTMLNAARSSASVYGAGFVEVSTTQELFDYLNQGKDRKLSPIEHLSLFSHGVPQQIAFGYQLADDLQMSLDVLNYNQISPLAFSSSAQIDSYACRTGMGNRSEYPIEDGIQFFPQTNESLAQLLADHLQIKVRAYVRRSDYKNTWGSFEERQLGKLCGISNNMVPDNEWCKRWEQLEIERQEHNDDFNFTYQNMGGIHPVISGETPFGVPGGHFEFLPK